MSTNVPASEKWRTYDSRPVKPNGWMYERDIFERQDKRILDHAPLDG